MLFKFIRAIPLYDITRIEVSYVFTATNLKISRFLTAVNSLSIIFLIKLTNFKVDNENQKRSGKIAPFSV